MNFLDIANKRRSCRSYSLEPVPEEAIKRCLEAARLAPSACNSQPWYFIVLRDPELKAKVGRLAFSGIYSMNSFAKEAQVLIIVLRQKSSYIARMGGAFRGIQYSLIDLGVACEHFILQATEEGLGTCWIGWFNEKGLKKALGISRSEKVDILISLGYPQDAEVAKEDRRLLREISETR